MIIVRRTNYKFGLISDSFPDQKKRVNSHIVTIQLWGNKKLNGNNCYVTTETIKVSLIPPDYPYVQQSSFILMELITHGVCVIFSMSNIQISIVTRYGDIPAGRGENIVYSYSKTFFINLKTNVSNKTLIILCRIFLS